MAKRILGGKEDSAKFALSLSSAAGWDMVSATAVKLYVTLAASGATGSASLRTLADRAGISRRTAATCIVELAALQWLGYEGTTGAGVTWKLKRPPKTLADDAVAYYQYQIDKRRWKLEIKSMRLLAMAMDAKLAERKELVARLDELQAMIDSAETPDAKMVEQQIADIQSSVEA